MASVRVIPATIRQNSAHGALRTAKRRTAAYARVSTDSEEQLTSYEAQVDYYTKYIKERADWEFVRVYTDEGISATNTKKRDGFKQMIADALDGKIDLIITKSVSRFARNTVDSLVTVRQLKEKGVEVYFEKENIYTLDSKGELLITIMSSLAQEESRSISENVTWGQRKRMADGKVSLPYGQFLGYEKGEDGLPKIVESEAEIVRMIFRLFIEGKTPSAIAKQLASQGIPSPAGKKTWQVATVKSILTNEKYKGDALLQKKFTIDFLTKKQKVNEGEVPQYYVQNSHPAIIQPDEFDAVQAEIERRKKLGRPSGCNSPFSTKIVCGDCGGFYGSKVWGSNTKYRRTIWRCNEKYKKDRLCRTPHVTEEDVKERFLIAFNTLMGGREELIDNCRLAQQVLCDCSAIEAELAELSREIEIVCELTRKAIYENARFAVNQDEFNERHGGYLERHRKAAERIAELEVLQRERQNKALILEKFMKDIEARPLAIDEFDEQLWAAAVDKAMVLANGKLIFTFKDGTEI
ncbi:MAG: recombinase family protein [Dethiobacter sp.]|jgi:DNA invertase Pin-like site-specific DNA recombinase|nr:MAG: recombinase family protein [Dethiobacter sp.]